MRALEMQTALGLASMAGRPGWLARSLLEGKPRLREQPKDPAAVAFPSLTFSLS